MSIHHFLLLCTTITVNLVSFLVASSYSVAEESEIQIITLNQTLLNLEPRFHRWLLSKDPKSSGPLTVDCKGFRYFGGKEFTNSMSIVKMFSNLPTHTHVRVSFEIIFIDNWLPHEEIIMTIDNDPAPVSRMAQGRVKRSHLCGDPTIKDTKYIFFEQIKHSKPVLAIEIHDTTKGGYWGIANFRVQTIIDEQASVTKYFEWSDFERDDFDTFITPGWVAFLDDATNPSLMTMSCGEYTMLTGTPENRVYQQLGVTTRLVPGHHLIRIKGRIILIDDWAYEPISLRIDGKVVYTMTKDEASGSICGDSLRKDHVLNIDISLTQPVSSGNLYVSFNDDLPSTKRNAYWGLVSLMISTSENGGTTWEVQYDSYKDLGFKKIWGGRLFTPNDTTYTVGSHDYVIIADTDNQTDILNQVSLDDFESKLIQATRARLMKLNKTNDKGNSTTAVKTLQSAQKKPKAANQQPLNFLTLGGYTIKPLKKLVNCVRTPSVGGKIATNIQLMVQNQDDAHLFPLWSQVNLVVNQTNFPFSYPESDPILHFEFEDNPFQHRCLVINFLDPTALQERVFISRVSYKYFSPCSPACATCKTSTYCLTCPDGSLLRDGTCFCKSGHSSPFGESPLHCDVIEDACYYNKTRHLRVDLDSDKDIEANYVHVASTKPSWSAVRRFPNGSAMQFNFKVSDAMSCHFAKWMGSFQGRTTLSKKYKFDHAFFFVMVSVRIVVADYNVKGSLDKNSFCLTINNLPCTWEPLPFARPIGTRAVRCRDHSKEEKQYFVLANQSKTTKNSSRNKNKNQSYYYSDEGIYFKLPSGNEAATASAPPSLINPKRMLLGASTGLSLPKNSAPSLNTIEATTNSASSLNMTKSWSKATNQDSKPLAKSVDSKTKNTIGAESKRPLVNNSMIPDVNLSAYRTNQSNASLQKYWDLKLPKFKDRQRVRFWGLECVAQPCGTIGHSIDMVLRKGFYSFEKEVTVNVHSNLNSEIAFWGMRELKIETYKCDEPCEIYQELSTCTFT